MSFHHIESELHSAYRTHLSLFEDSLTSDPLVGYGHFPGLCFVDFSHSDCNHVQASALIYPHPVLIWTITGPRSPRLHLAPLCPLLLLKPVIVNRSFMWLLLSYFMALFPWSWHQVPPEQCWEVIQMSLLRATTDHPSPSMISTSVCGLNGLCPLGEFSGGHCPRDEGSVFVCLLDSSKNLLLLMRSLEALWKDKY